MPYFNKEHEIAIYQELVTKLETQEALNELPEEGYSNDLALEIIEDLHTFSKTLQILTEQEEKLQKKFEIFYNEPEKLVGKDNQDPRLQLSFYFRIRRLQVENIEKQDIYTIIMNDIQESEKDMPDNPLKSLFF